MMKMHTTIVGVEVEFDAVEVDVEIDLRIKVMSVMWCR
jgi:hypothetical protein